MPTGTCMLGAVLGDQKPRGWQTEQAQSTACQLPCSTVGGTGQGQKDTPGIDLPPVGSKLPLLPAL